MLCNKRKLKPIKCEINSKSCKPVICVVENLQICCNLRHQECRKLMATSQKDELVSSLPMWIIYVILQIVTTKVFPYQDLIRSNDHHKLYDNQALIIIPSKRNTFIILNQNKCKSSLNLVAKLKNFNVHLLLWRVVTKVSLYRLAGRFSR